MEQELRAFLFEEFKSTKKVNTLLRNIYDQIGVSNLDITNPEKRRTLAMVLKSELPSVSIARGNLLFSRILSILHLDGQDEITRLQLNPREKKILQQNLMVHDFWTDVDKSLMKFEIIFNMFWLRAGEAEARGMTHRDVLRITKKSMAAVKNELERSYDQLRDQFNLEESSEKLRRASLFSASKEHYVSLNENTGNLYKKEHERSEIEGYIEEFWHVIVDNYAEFERIFFDSLDKEVILKRARRDDSQYIEKVRKELSFIWAAIEDGYRTFQQKLNHYQDSLSKQ